MNEALTKELLAATTKFADSQHAFLSAIVFTMEIEALSRTDESIRVLVEEFEKRTKKLDLTLRSYFRSNLFAYLISCLEIFFQEAITAVIRTHPQKIGSTQFRLIDIMETTSTEALIQRASEEYLNKLMYKKPAEYLEEICNILSIDKKIFTNHWPIFIEAKARRDIGVHNNWICNEIYLRKVKEAGLETSFKVGDKLFPTERQYLFDIAKATSEISFAMQAAITEKHA